MTLQLSTRVALALLVFCVAVPLIVFTAGVAQYAVGRQGALIERQNIDTARAISVSIDQEVEKTMVVLASVASFLSLIHI